VIIGSCPHCDAPTMTPIGPTPCYSKETCDSCNKEYWLKHSRLNPEAYTEKPKKVGKKLTDSLGQQGKEE
jgi:hypothetical protein